MPFSQNLPDFEAFVGGGVVVIDGDDTGGRRWGIEER
jgi:hypothetical protein